MAGRATLTYLIVVSLFAAGYYLLGRMFDPPVSPLDAVIISMYTFHGRGLFNTYTKMNAPVYLGAVESLVGLILEISFIAAFTHRFFRR